MVKNRFSLFVFTWVLLFFFIEMSAQSLIKPGAELKRIADGYSFTGGPACDQSGDVYFTDQPNNRILKWSSKLDTVVVWMENAGRSNGLYVDGQGNLLACADEENQLWQIDRNKEVSILIREVNGLLLNGPNDLWLDPEGGIYFTDPFYNRPYWKGKEMEMKHEEVYYISPDRTEIKTVIGGFQKPNGIIGSSNGKYLYVADIGADKTYRFTINNAGHPEGMELFAEMGSDGMTMDELGNVYLTGEGVTVFNPQGIQILHIPVDADWTANVTFGGEDRKTLFITAMDAVYTLDMNVRGLLR